MREILFRGKMKYLNLPHKKGDWVYGNYVEFNDGDRTIHCIYGYGDVILETVGQYTGLTDKNGVKIFEGDIIKGKEKTAYTVEYCSGIASFCARAASPSPQKMLPCMTNGTMKYYKVIGNIHDNPELLKAEGNDENVDNGR